VASDLEVVRLLISDVGGETGTDFIFTDEEVEAFLELTGAVRLAAAEALRAIAGNEAMVSKRITYLELSTDGPAVAKELRELADSLTAAHVAGAEEAEDEGFEIAEMNLDWNTRRAMLFRQYGLVP
jgi:hypothetical protein